MSDRHVRILAMVARHSQRKLDDNAIAGTPSAGSTERRKDLKARAIRTRARVVAARARRQRPTQA
jgi:hypothetical protein